MEFKILYLDSTKSFDSFWLTSKSTFYRKRKLFVDEWENSFAINSINKISCPVKKIRKVQSDYRQDDVQFDQLGNIPLESNFLSSNNEESSSNMTSESYSSACTNLVSTNIKEAFAIACIKTKTPRNHVNVFLHTLKPFLPELPNDYRALLKTSRNIQIFKCGDGECYQSLISAELLFALSDSDISKATFDFHIDGIPLSKSSKLQLWPIVCFIRETGQIIPFRIYQGSTKPSRSDLFGNVIEQLLDVIKNGIAINSRTISVQIGNFLCDSPARAMVLNITHHSGTFSCHICHTYMKKKKYIRTGGRKEVLRNNFSTNLYETRTDEEFRNKEFYSHHSNKTFHRTTEQIEVEALPIDIIRCFPVDYMHSVLLGVFKNLIKIWIKSIDCFTENFNGDLTKVHDYIPYEFTRKCRDVTEQWKATEYRLALLYIGPIVLKSILNKQQYKHFLKLSIAIRILCSDRLMKRYMSVADKMIHEFVYDFQILYDEPISYNIHMLSHLVQCCKQNNMTLDGFSCFNGENYLQKLVNYYDRGPNPLLQIVKRLDEEINILGRPLTGGDKKIGVQSRFRKGMKGTKIYDLPMFSVSTRFKDSFVQVKNFVVKIEDIKEQNNGSAIFQGRIFNVSNYFATPLNSCEVRIYKGSENSLANPVQFTDLDISSKYFAYQSPNCISLVELLHSKFPI